MALIFHTNLTMSLQVALNLARLARLQLREEWMETHRGRSSNNENNNNNKTKKTSRQRRQRGVGAQSQQATDLHVHFFFFTFIHSCLFSFQPLAQPGWLNMHALSQQHPAAYSQFNTFTPAAFRHWTAVWGWVCGSWASPWHVSTFKIFLNPLVLTQGYGLMSFPHLLFLLKHPRSKSHSWQ